MSQVKISGNASGTGILTVAAPNTNTDYTLTLPAETGTVLSSVTAASSIPGNGALLEADAWRLSSGFTTSAGENDVTANLVRSASIRGFAKIGTGMSQSSGIFTFPRTGVYYVTGQANIYHSAATQYVGLVIRYTSDNSTYNYSTDQASSIYTPPSGNYYAVPATSYIFNITDTTQQKIKFTVVVPGTTSVQGDGNADITWFRFIRLGDAQ